MLTVGQVAKEDALIAAMEVAVALAVAPAKEVAVTPATTFAYRLVLAHAVVVVLTMLMHNIFIDST